MSANGRSPLPFDRARLSTVAEVADQLAVSVRTVRTLIALGELAVIRVGARAIRVAESDLAAFIESRRKGAAT